MRGGMRAKKTVQNQNRQVMIYPLVSIYKLQPVCSIKQRLIGGLAEALWEFPIVVAMIMEIWWARSVRSSHRLVAPSIVAPTIVDEKMKFGPLKKSTVRRHAVSVHDTPVHVRMHFERFESNNIFRVDSIMMVAYLTERLRMWRQRKTYDVFEKPHEALIWTSWCSSGGGRKGVQDNKRVDSCSLFIVMDGLGCAVALGYDSNSASFSYF